MKTIHIEYFAILREQADRASESLVTDAETAEALFQELQSAHGFAAPSNFKVAINDEFSVWAAELHDGDRVVFIPPVAGG